MKKININKIFFMILCSIGIGLGCFTSALMLVTKNILLEMLLLFCTYFLGVMVVKVRGKYSIYKD